MKTIPLSQDQYALVDDEDFSELTKFRWFAMWDKNTKQFYAARNVRSDGPRPWRTLRMHSAIMRAKPRQWIDHRDGNGLNNQKSNLRFATGAQNAQNKKCRADNPLRIKGVSIEEGKFRARIRVGGVLKHLGLFSSAEAAHAAYCVAAQKHFGDFARFQ